MKKSVTTFRIVALSLVLLQIVIVAVALSPLGANWTKADINTAEILSKGLWAGFLISVVVGASIRDKSKKQQTDDRIKKLEEEVERLKKDSNSGGNL